MKQHTDGTVYYLEREMETMQSVLDVLRLLLAIAVR